MGQKYGGKIVVRLSSGEVFSLRGTFGIMPSSQSNEAIVNQDGSVDIVGTPQGRRFELNFADKGIDYDALMKGPRFNVTAIEEFTGVIHYFSDAGMIGDPNINRVNGEVTGLSGIAEGYNRGND